MFKKIIQIYADCKADADLKAIRKQAAKEEKKKQKREEKKRQEAVNCPHCNTSHDGIYYYRHKTKKEDFKIACGAANINFTICKAGSCKRLFGVKEIFINCDCFRHAFKLIDEE